VLKLLKRESSSPEPTKEGAGEPVDPLLALAVAAAAGKQDARHTLSVALAPALLRAVRGVLGAMNPEVDDVLQEALVAVLNALPGFRGDCRTLHFACRVAVQTAMNARRKAGYRARHTPSVDPDELVELARDERSPAQAHDEARRRGALRQLLDELPGPQAEALVLHTVLGYSIDETALATSTPSNTVRSRLRAALTLLRERIRDDGVLVEVLGGER
jgi:RNA polymerase sigma factor (sigma-70 family)